jgi:hypothetical protein
MIALCTAVAGRVRCVCGEGRTCLGVHASTRCASSRVPAAGPKLQAPSSWQVLSTSLLGTRDGAELALSVKALASIHSLALGSECQVFVVTRRMQGRAALHEAPACPVIAPAASRYSTTAPACCDRRLPQLIAAGKQSHFPSASTLDTSSSNRLCCRYAEPPATSTWRLHWKMCTARYDKLPAGGTEGTG